MPRPAGLLIAIGKSPKKGLRPSDDATKSEETDEVRDLLGQAYEALAEKDKEGFVDLLSSAIKACCADYMDSDDEEDDADSEEL